jgi:hypothetical protein
MAVLGVPSSESRWISFRATSSPVWRLRPLKTWGVLVVFEFVWRYRNLGVVFPIY